MIFVTAGSAGYDDLFKKIDELVKDGKITEEVICQISDGSYIPQNCKYFRVAPSITDYIKNANLVISHGGMTIFKILKEGKTVIGVFNPNNVFRQQVPFLEKLAQEGFFLFCSELDQLYDYITSNAPLRPYHNDNRELIKSLKEFIDER